MRVVFFGTPEFAFPSLGALLGEGFDVVAVVTQPDRPRGRSRSSVAPPPVKLAAKAEGVPVLQPERPADAGFIGRVRALAPDIGVVVAYGHILRPDLLAVPPRGMVNVHPSLLPELRGAAPVEWAILRGLEKTGVTIMQMEAGMDSGPIIHQIPHRIDPDVSAGELSDHLAEMGAQALIEALAMLEQNGLALVPQDHSQATFAPKLTREMARIDWTKPVPPSRAVSLPVLSVILPPACFVSRIALREGTGLTRSPSVAVYMPAAAGMMLSSAPKAAESVMGWYRTACRFGIATIAPSSFSAGT